MEDWQSGIFLQSCILWDTSFRQSLPSNAWWGSAGINENLMPLVMTSRWSGFNRTNNRCKECTPRASYEPLFTFICVSFSNSLEDSRISWLYRRVEIFFIFLCFKRSEMSEHSSCKLMSCTKPSLRMVSLTRRKIERFKTGWHFIETTKICYRQNNSIK